MKITPPKAKNTDNIVPLPKASKVDDVSKKIDNPQKQIIDDVNSGKIPLE